MRLFLGLCLANFAFGLTDPFIFKDGFSKCKMYMDDYCKIPVLIRSDVQLYDIKIKNTQDRKYYRIVKIEECDNGRTILLDFENDCKNSTFDFGQNQTSEQDYKV